MQLSEKDLNIKKILEGVRDLGSIKKACKAANISYSYGHKILSEFEKEHKFELTETTKFEGSYLTKYGEKVLRFYKRATKNLENLSKRL